jgi:competence ComEA-like helix-hairpin-helix protein
MATRTRQRIDINAASAQEIERACGIDGVLAERIVDYREQHGPFSSRDELDQVPGFAEIRTDQVLSVVDLPSRSSEPKRRSNATSSRARARQPDSEQGSHEGASAARPRSRSSRSSSRSQSASTGSDSHPSSRSAEPTTDHDFIRNWVEERGGWPARVKGTGRSNDDPGMIRIDFPGFSGRESLERIDWDEWFQQFDENELAFLHRDMRHSDGQLDRFNKLVRRNPEKDE